MKHVLRFLCIATVSALTCLSHPDLGMAEPHGKGGGPHAGGGSFGGPHGPYGAGGGRSFGSFMDHVEVCPVAVGGVERSVVCLMALEEEAAGAAKACAASTAV